MKTTGIPARYQAQALTTVAAILVFVGASQGNGAWAKDGSACRKLDPDRDVSFQLPPSALVVTPAVWPVMQAPVIPVRGSDGRFHLDYELQFTNLAAATVRIDAVRVLDPLNGNATVGTNAEFDDEGRDVTAKLKPFGVRFAPGSPAFTASLGAGRGGVMYFDVTVANHGDVPAVIAHQVTLSLPDTTGSQPTTAVGGVVPVCANDIVTVRPPLLGKYWIDAFGCCAFAAVHRSTVLPINGRLRLSQRFAIDFVQLDQAGRAWEGDPKVLSNWICYGAPIYSATSGRVVATTYGLPDQPVGGLPPDLPIGDALGNSVIVDIGKGRYALYAHMAPDSVRVSPGDRVWPGTMLGLLGNSGNSSAPHLHFQLMDRPSGLDANGLPFVFDRWFLEGRVTSTPDMLEAELQAGRQLAANTSGRGEHRSDMPLIFDLADFW